MMRTSLLVPSYFLLPLFINVKPAVLFVPLASSFIPSRRHSESFWLLPVSFKPRPDLTENSLWYYFPFKFAFTTVPFPSRGRHRRSKTAYSLQKSNLNIIFLNKFCNNYTTDTWDFRYLNYIDNNLSAQLKKSKQIFIIILYNYILVSIAI